MTDPHDRAEQAFADAFSRADAISFAPLDPDALRDTSPRLAPLAPRGSSWRRRWLPVAAAAVLLVGVVPIGVQLLSQRGQTAAVPALSGAPDMAAGAAPQAAEGPGAAGTRSAGLQALQPGFRWASMGDVVVQVPQAWGYGRSIGPDWCVEGAERQPGDPTEPFVDVRPEGRAVRAIACPGDVPADRQTMHLTWRHVDAPAPARTTPRGWIAVAREVGSLVLTVVAPEGQASLAEQVVASAQRVAVDHNGCPTVAPVTPATPDARPADRVVADIVGETVVLCQYDDLTRTAANLVGSRVLPAAPSELSAASSFTPATPRSCTPDPRGDTLVVVRWPNLGIEHWLRVPGCGAATIDTGRDVHPASSAACDAVFVAPLALPDGTTVGDSCRVR